MAHDRPTVVRGGQPAAQPVGPAAPQAARHGPPGTGVVANKHSTAIGARLTFRVIAHIDARVDTVRGCRCRPTYEYVSMSRSVYRRSNVGRVLVLNNPPAWWSGRADIVSRILNPRFFTLTATHDVASNTWQALPRGAPRRPVGPRGVDRPAPGRRGQHRAAGRRPGCFARGGGGC